MRCDAIHDAITIINRYAFYSNSFQDANEWTMKKRGGEGTEAIDTNCLEEKNQGRENQSRKGAESQGEQFLVLLLLRRFSSV